MRYLRGMVRNEELPEMGAFAVRAATAVRARAKSAGLTQVQLAEELGRAQSYVSVRWSGRKAWTLNELDIIARMVGEDDVLSLLRP